ncbi:hypothetical protein SI859A1_01627 [Aurantimonas manganoxydans SI85-9A1]|uniref:Uncharacterized protein n=1 Tax=Aurantimonas manganoxydans (strain ATCC BAA-1229 / DSM 21871 / SI85-9A1) TaxID=287752 RepID=Q1YI58_AURMS|nr:hypothetical protein SI859A1_01627 [Aurantimonas manganoxydans SI85-9A1]
MIRCKGMGASRSKRPTASSRIGRPHLRPRAAAGRIPGETPTRHTPPGGAERKRRQGQRRPGTDVPKRSGTDLSGKGLRRWAPGADRFGQLAAMATVSGTVKRKPRTRSVEKIATVHTVTPQHDLRTLSSM